jgi:hypothetical protein
MLADCVVSCLYPDNMFSNLYPSDVQQSLVTSVWTLTPLAITFVWTSMHLIVMSNHLLHMHSSIHGHGHFWVVDHGFKHKCLASNHLTCTLVMG